jgi:hypothetical protein
MQFNKYWSNLQILLLNSKASYTKKRMEYECYEGKNKMIVTYGSLWYRTMKQSVQFKLTKH